MSSVKARVQIRFAVVSRHAQGPLALSPEVFEQALRIEAADALSWMPGCAPQRFELVFIDPPFEAQLFDKALAAAIALRLKSALSRYA